MLGRVEVAVGYADAAALLLTISPQSLPHGIEGWLGGAYLPLGRPEQWAEFCAAQLERRGDDSVYIRSCRVFALAFAGLFDEADAAAEGLAEAGAATGNPYLYTFAVGATGYQASATNSSRGLDLCREALEVARESGNSFNEAMLAMPMARFEAAQRVTPQGLEHVTNAIRSYHDSGNVLSLSSPLGLLSSFLDRLGRSAPAAMIAGFALSPFTAKSVPELLVAVTHLRSVLGDDVYESLARTGKYMTMAEIVAYAYDQIDQARAQLERLR
jgi:hypothetical protein